MPGHVGVGGKAARLPGMTLRTLFAAGLLLLGAGCGNALALPGVETPGATASITLESVGGIASLRVRLHLDSAGATLTRETCGMNVSGTSCGSSGRRDVTTVPPAEVSRLFAMTNTSEFRALRADYGRSTQGADLMDHRLAIISGGRLRTIHADDITRPEAMAALMAALNR